MMQSLKKFVLIFATTVAACNSQPGNDRGQATSETGTQAAPGSASGDPSVVHHPETPARPEEKRDSIQLEGNWEPLTAKLFKPHSDVPFSVYVPEDMLFEQASSGEGEGFYFYTNFGGKRNQDAFMLVFMLPRGASASDAQRLADAFTSSRTRSNYVAGVQLGSYQDRHFYVAYTYPAEFADGMGPRTHFIRSEWIWLNDGRSLQSTLQARP